MQEFMMEHPGWSFLILATTLYAIFKIILVLRVGKVDDSASRTTIEIESKD